VTLKSESFQVFVCSYILKEYTASIIPCTFLPNITMNDQLTQMKNPIIWETDILYFYAMSSG